MIRGFSQFALTLGGIVLLWQVVVAMTGTPAYILPPPLAVAEALARDAQLLAGHASVTAIEIVAGLLCGTALGGLSALTMAGFRPARRWLLPLLVASQALPVFALAPILVLWLGYGLPSKIAMATLIIYFPVTATFYDGLRRTDPGWLDLAHAMGADSLAVMRHIRLPAALPAMASGLKVSAAVAPIGAVVGEWVGSSAGLGYLMLHANARLKTDQMFAALIVLAIIGLALYFSVDRLSRRLLPWQADDLHRTGD